MEVFCYFAICGIIGELATQYRVGMDVGRNSKWNDGNSKFDYSGDIESCAVSVTGKKKRSAEALLEINGRLK